MGRAKPNLVAYNVLKVGKQKHSDYMPKGSYVVHEYMDTVVVYHGFLPWPTGRLAETCYECGSNIKDVADKIRKKYSYTEGLIPKVYSNVGAAKDWFIGLEAKNLDDAELKELKSELSDILTEKNT